jgi:hypothetical protein
MPSRSATILSSGQTTRRLDKASKRRGRFEGVSLLQFPSKLNPNGFGKLIRL